MSRHVIIQPEAELDLRLARDWYEDREVGLGSRFLVAARAAMVRMAEAPHRFRLIGESIRRGRIPDFPYSVHFVDHDGLLVVLGVLHHSLDPSVAENRARGYRPSNH